MRTVLTFFTFSFLALRAGLHYFDSVLCTVIYTQRNIACIYCGGLSDIVTHLNESYRHGEL